MDWLKANKWLGLAGGVLLFVGIANASSFIASSSVPSTTSDYQQSQFLTGEAQGAQEQTDQTQIDQTQIDPSQTDETDQTQIDQSQTDDTQSASDLSNDNYYTNVDGNDVHAPAYSNDATIPDGATAQCSDGTYSFSQHHSGTCSHHGGVENWLQ